MSTEIEKTKPVHDDEPKPIIAKHLAHIVCVSAKHFTNRENSFVDYTPEPGDIIIARRHELEQTEEYRQLLPTKVFIHEGKVWAYGRTKAGSEAGLHGQVSVCVGGHLDLEDIQYKKQLDEKGKPVGSVIDIEKSITVAVEREIEEEVKLTSKVTSIKSLNSVLVADNTPVDRKHVAIISVVELDGMGLESAEEDLDSMGFICPRELLANDGKDYELETWARFVCQMLVKDSAQ